MMSCRPPITAALVVACLATSTAVPQGRQSEQNRERSDGAGAQADVPFQPGKQRAIAASANGIDVKLVETERCGACVSGFRHTVEMSASGNAARRLVLDGPAQVDEIRVVSPTRALIVGQAQSSVGEVIVVDPRGGTIVDRFLGFRPTVSPDGLRVAYVKVFPLHFTEGTSAQYLVYDLTLPPLAHRHPSVAAAPPGAPDDVQKNVNVGVPLYPPDARNQPDDNYLALEGAQHSLRSGFSWSEDSRKVAFSDWVNNSQWIVLADLSSGVQTARIRSTMLDPALIVSSGCREYQGKEADAFTVSQIEYLNADGTKLRLHFRFNVPACGRADALSIDLP